jgi:hypothetical protein
MADVSTGKGPVAVWLGSDRYLTLQRGSTVMALPVRYSADPDVVRRPDGSWIIFGRGAGGRLYYYDSRSDRQRSVSLGGVVR